MKKDKKIVWLFGLSIAGVLFSGYLSGKKFFTATCAFNEPCPYFLGLPACYFGFALFLLITIFSTMLFFSKIRKSKGLQFVEIFSFLGVLFAGYFTLGELPTLFQDGFGAYMLGLPTCAMGLVFFLIIFILAVVALTKNRYEVREMNMNQ